MAIKNLLYGGAADWADGDILYAVDQNDTVDATFNQNLQKTGGTMSGNITMDNNDLLQVDWIGEGVSAASNMSFGFSAANVLQLRYAGSMSSQFIISGGETSFLPSSDNEGAIGSGSNRWEYMYCKTIDAEGGTIDGTLDMSSNDIIGVDIIGYSTSYTNIDFTGFSIDLSATIGDVTIKPNWVGIYTFDATGLYPSTDCSVDLGKSSSAWDDVYMDNSQTGECDVAELQFVENGINLIPGTIVEMAPNNEEAQELYDDLKLWSEELAELRPVKHARRPFHKEVGRSCMWKIASERSSKCPSIISKTPTITMGSNPYIQELYKEGKVRAITLSGSVPDVMVEGIFEVGDLIVSAGNGNGVVDNNAPFNQIVGWCKESGKDRRIEIWIK